MLEVRLLGMLEAKHKNKPICFLSVAFQYIVEREPVADTGSLFVLLFGQDFPAQILSVNSQGHTPGLHQALWFSRACIHMQILLAFLRRQGASYPLLGKRDYIFEL